MPATQEQKISRHAFEHCALSFADAFNAAGSLEIREMNDHPQVRSLTGCDDYGGGEIAAGNVTAGAWYRLPDAARELLESPKDLGSSGALPWRSVQVADLSAYQAAEESNDVETANNVHAMSVARMRTLVKEVPPDTTPRSPNRVLSAEEFVGELKPREWRVDGLLQLDSELTALVAPPGGGKSFLALDLATAISTGMKWNGRAVKAGNVVFVCAEGAGDFRYRVAAVAKARDLALWQMPTVVANAPNLLKADHVADLIAQIKAAGGCDCLIVDTLAATSAGAAENESKDAGIFIANLKAINRQTGAQVIYTHHCGKDAAKGQRGHSSLLGAVDTEITIAREAGDVRTATVTKSKGGADGWQFAFKLAPVELGTNDKGAPFGSCVVEYVEVKPPVPPLNENAAKLYEIAHELLLDRDSVPEIELREKARSLQPAVRNFMRTYNRALNELASRKRIEVTDGNVSLRIKKAAAEDFDEA